jgi:Conjugative transposon protein TcpC
VRKARDQNEAGQRREAPRALRATGRLAIWVAIGLLLARGALATFAAPRGSEVRVATAPGDEVIAATAERFARLYLEDPDPKALRPYLAAGPVIGAGRPPSAEGAEVAQADVVDTSHVGDGRVVVTVSCELRDARTLYLTVPIVRQGPGEAAVLGAPSIVAMPAPAGADPESPRPVAGAEADAISELVAKFIPAYLSAGSSKELSYLLTPQAEVVPLGSQFELVSVGHVDQLGDGEGPRRDLLVAAKVKDPVGGATYPLAYRLSVVERSGRWYVAAVEGAIA